MKSRFSHAKIDQRDTSASWRVFLHTFWTQSFSHKCNQKEKLVSRERVSFRVIAAYNCHPFPNLSRSEIGQMGGHRREISFWKTIVEKTALFAFHSNGEKYEHSRNRYTFRWGDWFYACEVEE